MLGSFRPQGLVCGFQDRNSERPPHQTDLEQPRQTRTKGPFKEILVHIPYGGYRNKCLLDGPNFQFHLVLILQILVCMCTAQVNRSKCSSLPVVEIWGSRPPLSAHM